MVRAPSLSASVTVTGCCTRTSCPAPSEMVTVTSAVSAAKAETLLIEAASRSTAAIVIVLFMKTLSFLNRGTCPKIYRCP